MKDPAFICLLLLLNLPVFAQPAVLKTGTLEQLESSVLDENRSLFVHLPDDYSRSTERYPVLYVLDAEWNFRKVVGIVDHLSASERIPSMIIIGIPNTIRAGRPTRFSDLAPSPPGASGSDDAGKFLQFLAEELIPFIDLNYRTQPHRTLLGHSLGGLFTVYALLQDSSAFSAYISISPSLGRNGQQQVKNAAVFFAEQSKLQKNLQLSLGNEGGNTQLGMEALVAVLEEKAPGNLDWQFRHLQDEDHISIYHKGTSESLESIFDGWSIRQEYLTDNDISVAERHYQSLSKRLGYEVAVPESYYFQLGYRILAELDFDYGKWTFDRYIEAYPASASAWVGQGDVQLMRGDLEAAQESYEQALEIDPGNERAILMSKALTTR